jgi:predicted TIM-barrel fold metal-dependent hydrolase
MLLRHSDRILYGTDWPNIPYDWCRELANLVSLIDGDGEATAVVAGGGERGERKVEEKLRTRETDEALENILWRNASKFYRISEQDLGLEPLSHKL